MADAAEPVELSRRLNLFDASSLVVGAVIGSAIFLIPSTILKTQPSALAAMLIFLFAGVMSFAGALAYAELASMMPATGGEYVYLREAWGPLAAFVCGWSYFLVVQSGGIAALAAGFATLLSSVAPLGNLERRACSALLLILLTIINIRGVKQGAWAGNLLSVCKVAGLVTMVLALTSGSFRATAVDWSWPADWTLLQFASALIPVLWAYEGWNMVTFVGGEMRSPQTSIPRAMACGLALVMIVYMLSMWVYFRALTVPEIIASEAVAADASIRVLGRVGGTLVAITMLIALAGSANASVLAAPRVYFAQARDGLLWQWLGRVHRQYRTPVNALLVQAIWSIALAVTGTYETLLGFCTFGAWIFYTLVVAGLIRLRRTRPDVPRSYRMWGYPWTPVLFILVASAFVISTLVSQPGSSLAGLGLILSGVPFYLYRQRKS